MFKKIILCCLCFSATTFAEDNWTSPDFSIGFSFENENSLLLPKNAEATQHIVPKLSLLASIDKQLTTDWLLTTGVSLDYSQSKIDFTVNGNSINSTIENTGLWLDTKLTYQSFHESISPFVEVNVGKVYGTYHTMGQSHSDWQTGVKVSTGLEFTLSNDSTISFAVGHSNIDSMN